MLEQLLKLQQQYINHYFTHLNIKEVESIVQACQQTEGLIVFTGVGKSGIIADKIAMTLVSTGTKALYLPPTNFLHGDIGILSEKDTLVLMSRSGETEELLNLVPFARKRRTKLIAVVSNAQSRLSKSCDLSITLPVERELCPFDLAPTTSTTVQLLWGDLLAVSLMRAKQFDLSQYVLNHPSGTIGKKMTLKVEDLMFHETPLATPQDSLVDVLVELSNKKCVSLLVINSERQLLGIFTDGDLRRALQTHGPNVLEKSLESLMTYTPLSVSKDLLAWDALKIMQKDPKKFVMILPVLEDKKVVGILRMHDIIQAGINV